MATILYNISIYLYQFIIWLASPFNKKAKLRVLGVMGFRDYGIKGLGDNGMSSIPQSLNPKIPQTPKSQTAWFHCASLGEFEQGRPVIEKFKETFPDYKILLTFFSPSGYEVRKNYAGADYICYLPADTPSNAREFIEHFKPSIAFFVKYEFWYNYLRILHEKQIPVISFSAIFRENQIFFKWYGGFHRNILKYFNHIFVQNKNSLDLLQSIGIQNVTVSEDTRFDRVQNIANTVGVNLLIRTFKDELPLLIIGSCWEEDFEVLAPFLNKFEKDLKVIIAPHEIHEEQIKLWKSKLTKAVTFSDICDDGFDFGPITITDEEIELDGDGILVREYTIPYITNRYLPNCLIIDNIGMLSSLYQYADFAWIGGAYGKGLHNILEAATFGLPIFFGNKKYKKFQEATDLERLGGAKPIANTEEFEIEFRKLYDDLALRNQKSEIIKKYVEENLGGTDKVITFIQGVKGFRDFGIKVETKNLESPNP